MAGKHTTEVSALDHVLGKPLAQRTGRERWRDRGITTLGLGGLAAFFWWWGWEHAVSEAVTAGGLAAYTTARSFWTRRSVARYDARRRNRPCSCDTCQRLRAEGLAG